MISYYVLADYNNGALYEEVIKIIRDNIKAKRYLRKGIKLTAALALALNLCGYKTYAGNIEKIGAVIDSYKGVPVYYNGMDNTKSFGTSYSKAGYYFGMKWQCVEYVKRFYYVAKNHKMPQTYGNARDFFDGAIAQGGFNKARGLMQYRNGGNVKPNTDDLLVFNDTKYGHVAIIDKVTSKYIEVIQQNVLKKTRRKYTLKKLDGNYYVGDKRKPAGWLRVK